MAQGKGGGQDSSGVDGMGPDAFGGTGGYGGDEGNLSDAHEGQVSSYGGDVMGSGMDGWDGVNPTDDPSGLGYGAMDGWGYAGQNQTAMDVDYSAYENPGTQFSPMEFGPQHQMGLSTQQLGHNVTVDPGISLSTQQLGPNPASLSTQQLGHNVTVGIVDPATTTLEAIAQQEHEQRQKEIALSTQQLGQNVTLGTPVDPVKQEMQFDFKNFYSALDDPDASLESKDLEIRGFINHISRKNYTDQGFFSKLGLLGSKLNQRQQIEQIENFMAKSGTQKSIEALNKAYSAQINENPGFRSFLPGYTAINALMTAIGLPGQHTHPAVKALYDKMEKLGMIERTRPEQESWTEAQKKAHCEAKEGWSWDSKLQACVKGGQKMLYNVHTGQYDIPPI